MLALLPPPPPPPFELLLWKLPPLVLPAGLPFLWYPDSVRLRNPPLLALPLLLLLLPLTLGWSVGGCAWESGGGSAGHQVGENEVSCRWMGARRKRGGAAATRQQQENLGDDFVVGNARNITACEVDVAAELRREREGGTQSVPEIQLYVGGESVVCCLGLTSPEASSDAIRKTDEKCCNA